MMSKLFKNYIILIPATKMPSSIVIKNQHHQTIIIKVDLSQDKVKNLYQKYCQKAGEEIEHIELVYNGLKLSSYMDRTLGSDPLNLSDMCLVHKIPKVQTSGGKIQLILCLINGKQESQEISQDMTGLQLKEYIYKNLSKSLEPHQMLLRSAGSIIENDKQLFHYKAKMKVNKRVVQQKEFLHNVKGIVIAQGEQDLLGQDTEVTRMKCGHVIGRDGMTTLVSSQISEGKYKILCPFKNKNNQVCNYEWDYYICCQIGIFTFEEKRKFQESLSKNGIQKEGSECPNCNLPVMKGDLKSNRVVCPKCKYGDFCYKCSKKWINQGFLFCGNPDCTILSLNYTLSESQMTRIFPLNKNGKKENIATPEFRACPKCQLLLQNFKNCKHTLCSNCKTLFCWVCLSVKEKGTTEWSCQIPYDYCRPVAPFQKF